MPKQKVYDKDLTRVKFNDHVNYITDKSIIKDGMTVKIEGKYYVKIGLKLVHIDPAHPINLADVNQESIQIVFDRKGAAITEVVND